MCFFTQLSKTAQELQHRFNATFEEAEFYQPSQYNGFLHPATPVITNANPDKIQLYTWGLIPPWARTKDIQKHTLNARIETIHTKPAFKHVASNRCLVLVDGFFEWKWLDATGKRKQKYLVTLATNDTFALGGLYNNWIDKTTGEIISTYTILTTAANELMSNIHNSKKRMPLILPPTEERDWLLGTINSVGTAELKAQPFPSS